MPSAEGLTSGSRRECCQGLQGSHSGDSRCDTCNFEENEYLSPKAAVSPFYDESHRWNYILGHSAMTSQSGNESITLRDDEEEFFDTDEYDSSPLHGSSSLTPCESLNSRKADEAPKALQAIQVLEFLQEYLSTPFSSHRFTRPDATVIHKRNPAIVSMCEEWMPYVDVVEPYGMKLLILPISSFFGSGQVLTWIEVMATTGNLYMVVDVARALGQWIEKAKTIGQSKDLIEEIDSLFLWTLDLEYVIAEYGSCLSSFPSEIYYLTPAFLPKKSPLRRQLEAQALLRKDPHSTNFIERRHWQPFKSIKLPSSLTSDRSLESGDLSRFTINLRGSLVAFRGSHQIIVFSAHTGSVIRTFPFPKRKPTFVAFYPRSPMISVTFSDDESQIIDLRTGSVIQDHLESSSHFSNANGHSGRNSRSVSLKRESRESDARNRSFQLDNREEYVSVPASYLEERTFAIGPDGVHAIVTTDGNFKVSDQYGNVLFSRWLKLDVETSESLIQGPLTTKHKANRSREAKNGETASIKSQISENLQPQPSTTATGDADDVHYHCYDVGLQMAEDMVVGKILRELKCNNQKSAESDLEISFNVKGNVAVLHTTNAFGGGFDLLHVANYSLRNYPKLHIIFPTPPQSIAGFSVNMEGNLIALCPPNLGIISVIRLSHGLEIYRIDSQSLQLTSLVGLSLVPGSEDVLMTAHSGDYATFWDLRRLSENPNDINSFNAETDISWNPDQQVVSSNGGTMLLNRATKKGVTSFLLQINENSVIQNIPLKQPLLERYQKSNGSMALANDGQSAIVGRCFYSFGTKPKTKKLAIPSNSMITICAVSMSACALAVKLPNGRSLVRVFNWPNSGTIQDWTPSSDDDGDIWGLAFDGGEKYLGVGMRFCRDGVNKFVINLIGRTKSGLSILSRTNEWDGEPIKMAFGKGREVVILARVPDKNIYHPSSYAKFVLTVPSDISGGSARPAFMLFKSSPLTAPTITPDGQVFYLGEGKNEGWIMRVEYTGNLAEGKEADKRIAWCPLSWRNIGELSLSSASDSGATIIFCVNKASGVAMIKLK